MRASFLAGHGYDGSPRVHDDLREWEAPVRRQRLIRLMQEEGLQARIRKRDKSTTMSEHAQPVLAAHGITCSMSRRGLSPMLRRARNYCVIKTPKQRLRQLRTLSHCPDRLRN